MVTQWQTLFFEDRFSHTHQKNADFVKLGDAMGVQAKRVSKPAELEAHLKWLIESDGPALLEVVTDQKVPVLPMVPTGSALHEFLVYDEGTSRLSLSPPPTNHPQKHKRSAEPRPRTDRAASRPPLSFPVHCLVVNSLGRFSSAFFSFLLVGGALVSDAKVGRKVVLGMGWSLIKGVVVERWWWRCSGSR